MIQKFLYRCFHFLGMAAWILIVLAITSCSGASISTPIPTPIFTPTPKPLPTVSVDVSPGLTVPLNQEVSLVVKVEPYEPFDWQWSVSGTSQGQLNSQKGETNVYTAAKPGVDNIVVETKTADGQIIKKTVAIHVMQAEAPTATPVQAAEVNPPATATPAQADKVRVTNLVDGQEVDCLVTVKGIYPLNLKEDIWPIVFVGGLYYPQDNGGKAALKNEGIWSQPVRFGDCNNPKADVGKQFILYIVTADAAANAKFEENNRSARSSGVWNIDPLPAGIILGDPMTFTRK